MLVSVALFYTICLKMHSMRYCIKMFDYIFRYSSQVSLRTATSQPHLNFAAQKGGCSRPNHGHTHLNSKVFRCCLNSNNNYYSQRISNIISGSSCLHVRGRCNISAVHFFVILHKPHLVYHIFSVIFTIFFYFVHILFIYNCYNNICLKENFS